MLVSDWVAWSRGPPDLSGDVQTLRQSHTELWWDGGQRFQVRPYYFSTLEWESAQHPSFYFVFKQQRQRTDFVRAGQCACFPSWYTWDKLHAGGLVPTVPQKVSFCELYPVIKAFSLSVCWTTKFCVIQCWMFTFIGTLHVLLLFRLQVYPLHSSVTLEEQNGVFLPPVPGYRKVKKQ